MSYIRAALARNDPGKVERFVILVAPNEFHATITLTGRRVHGPMPEAESREHLTELGVTADEIEKLLRTAHVISPL